MRKVRERDNSCQQRKHQCKARGGVFPVCSLVAQRGGAWSRMRKGRGNTSQREVEGLDLPLREQEPLKGLEHRNDRIRLKC